MVDAGVVGAIIKDPSGMEASDGVSRSGYMIGVDADHYTVWANLENPTAGNIATQDSCYFSGYDGYHSSFNVAARANYCVSN